MKGAPSDGEMREGDVWRGIVDALAGGVRPAPSRRSTMRAALAAVPRASPSLYGLAPTTLGVIPVSESASVTAMSAMVTVHGRASSITISVSWRDATACRYGEQIWREGIARRPGVCVLSNEQIEVGDCIYRPIPVAPRPANYHEMMLASALGVMDVIDTDL